MRGGSTTEGLNQGALGQPLELVAIENAPRSTSVGAVLRAAPHPRCAGAFVDFLGSPAGRRILAEHGFEPPDQAGK